MAEVTEIFSKLLERTRESKVLWKSTTSPQTFVAVIGDHSVMILVNDSGRAIFSVNNKTGETIETMSGSKYSTIGWQSELRELHELARHIALNVDSELDKLLRALEE